MKAGDEFLSLTPQGTEELRARAPKLGAGARMILAGIEQGGTSIEALVQRVKSPRPAVIAELSALITQRYLMISGGIAGGTSGDYGAQLRLKGGIALSQGRFTLSNFCLDQLGTEGQDLADIVNLCADVVRLQQALDSIRVEVFLRCSDRVGLLVDCAREINETDF